MVNYCVVSAGRELDAASAIFIADDGPKSIIFRCIGLLLHRRID